MKTASILAALLIAASLAATTTSAQAQPADQTEPGPPEGYECILGYNDEAFSNICLAKENTTYLVPLHAEYNPVCVIGGGDGTTCVPFFQLNFGTNSPFALPFGVYVELLCNQTFAPCGCYDQVCAFFLDGPEG